MLVLALLLMKPTEWMRSGVIERVMGEAGAIDTKNWKVTMGE